MDAGYRAAAPRRTARLAALAASAVLALAGCATPVAPPTAEAGRIVGGFIVASRPVPNGSPALIATEAAVAAGGALRPASAPQAATVELVVACDDGSTVSVVEPREPWFASGQRVSVAIGAHVSIARPPPSN